MAIRDFINSLKKELQEEGDAPSGEEEVPSGQKEKEEETEKEMQEKEREAVKKGVEARKAPPSGTAKTNAPVQTAKTDSAIGQTGAGGAQGEVRAPQIPQGAAPQATRHPAQKEPQKKETRLGTPADGTILQSGEVREAKEDAKLMTSEEKYAKYIESEGEEDEGKGGGAGSGGGFEGDAISSVRMGIEIDKLKAQITALREMRSISEERFYKINEEIGQLKNTIYEIDKNTIDLKKRAEIAASLVESVQPQTLLKEVKRGEIEVEKIKAIQEKTGALQDNMNAELKDIRARVAVFRGADAIRELNEEMQHELVELKKTEASIEQHADKVEYIYVMFQKKFSKFEPVFQQVTDLSASINRMRMENDKVKMGIADLATKNELAEVTNELRTKTKAIEKFSSGVERIKADIEAGFKEREDALQKMLEGNMAYMKRYMESAKEEQDNASRSFFEESEAILAQLKEYQKTSQKAMMDIVGGVRGSLEEVETDMGKKIKRIEEGLRGAIEDVARENEGRVRRGELENSKLKEEMLDIENRLRAKMDVLEGEVTKVREYLLLATRLEKQEMEERRMVREKETLAKKMKDIVHGIDSEGDAGKTHAPQESEVRRRGYEEGEAREGEYSHGGKEEELGRVKDSRYGEARRERYGNYESGVKQDEYARRDNDYGHGRREEDEKARRVDYARSGGFESEEVEGPPWSRQGAKERMAKKLLSDEWEKPSAGGDSEGEKVPAKKKLDDLEKELVALGRESQSAKKAEDDALLEKEIARRREMAGEKEEGEVERRERERTMPKEKEVKMEEVDIALQEERQKLEAKKTAPAAASNVLMEPEEMAAIQEKEEAARKAAEEAKNAKIAEARAEAARRSGMGRGVGGAANKEADIKDARKAGGDAGKMEERDDNNSVKGAGEIEGNAGKDEGKAEEDAKKVEDEKEEALQGKDKERPPKKEELMPKQYPKIDEKKPAGSADWETYPKKAEWQPEAKHVESFKIAEGWGSFLGKLAKAFPAKKDGGAAPAAASG